MLDGIESKDLAAIKKQADYISLEKLAMDFSDGVIQGSALIEQELEDYAQQKNIPFLPYQIPEIYVDTYNEFYNQILDKQ